jgi:putative addiction module component (TIGR02574 family)
MSYEEVKASALGLGLKERAALAKELLDSVDNPSEKELEDLWLDEVGKRIERVQSGETKLIPFEEALKRAKTLLNRNVAK